MKPLVAKYIGYTEGTENHGDEALIGIIRELLAPELDVKTDAVEYDVALLGGGTLINQSPWLIDYFGPALHKARVGLAFGTGVGDTLFWGNTLPQWKPLLDRCRFVCVRGPHSQQLLSDHAIRARMIGDPYLALRSPFEPRPIETRIGVNLGSTNNALLGGGNDGQYCEFVGSVLASLRQQGYTFTFISVWSKDIPVAKRVSEMIGGESPIIDARNATVEAYAALSRCRLFVGEKLHACAMAAVAGVPFVALEYQPKVRDFAASIGMENFVCSTAVRDPEELMSRINLALEQSAEIRDKLHENVASIRCGLYDAASEVRATLFNELRQPH